MSVSQNSALLKIIFDSGQGRAIVCLFDEHSDSSFALSIADRWQANSRVVVIEAQAISQRDFAEDSNALKDTLVDLKIRHASFVCFGAASCLLQNLILEEPKLVRTLVMINATARPHPTWWDRVVDWVEDHLPFGLPLRLGGDSFNVRSYLHRLRCPVLVVTTPTAGVFVCAEGDSIARYAPTAWRVGLSNTATVESELVDLIGSFQDTPAKCPQKNIEKRNEKVRSVADSVGVTPLL